MKVLTLTNMYPLPAQPGYGVFVEDQVRSLRALGIEVEVIFVNGRESQANYLRGIGRVRDALDGGRFDVVHAHYGLSGWVGRFQTRVPLVITFHGDDILGTPGGRFGRTAKSMVVAVASRVLQPLANATIVVSEEMRKRLWFSQSEVIPCGIDTTHFRPMPRDEALKAVELDPSKRYVIFPSTPQEVRKRLDLAEAAVRIVKEKRPNVELLIVHKKPHALLPAYYNASDVLLLTSDWEGSPMVVKESLACDVPVVAVPAGDVEERIGGLAGCHLCARDPASLANGLFAALDAPRPGGLREAVASLDTAVIAQRIAGVYERVLAKG